MMNLLGALAVSSALNLQRSTAVAQVITFTNPTPAYDDICSSSVGRVDPVRVLIAAPDEDTSASDAEAAYLFSAAVQTAAAPNLTIPLTPPNTVAA
jgi:hypothetical protein